MLVGTDTLRERFQGEGGDITAGMPSQKNEKQAIAESLAYVRDRVGVPRDMTVHGARQFRAHINWFIQELEK
jgi:glutathione S-transferase